MNTTVKFMQPVDIHLVSWNRPKMTDLVIRTIHLNTKPENFRLVVLDNNSTHTTKQMLVNMHDNGMIDELFLMDENMGLERARQFLLERAVDGEFFVCADNDCLPPPIRRDGDWIERLQDLMQRYEDFAAISARTQVMIGTGNIFEEADAVGDDIVEFPHPGGSLRMMRTKAVKEVGGWDRGADGRGAEERYIGGKLHDFGYRTAFATQVQCLHLFGTRGNNGTDRWGYEAHLRPEDTGHSDIHHPVLEQGDNFDELKTYCGEVLAKEYLR